MKKGIIILVVVLINLSTAFAQEWETDFAKAKEIATKENKPIVLVCQGSDWCAPCMKLDKKIWSTDKFKSYAQDHFVMLKADFPRKKANALSEEQQEKNSKLFEKYNLNGYFPFVVVLDKDGKVLGETGYQKVTPTDYITLLESF